MFERSIRLRQAEKALEQGRWEEALALASDPRIAAHRRAREIASRAREALLGRARERLEAGDPGGARRDLERAGGGEATLAGRIEAHELQAVRRGQEARQALVRLRALLGAGRPGRVLAELEASTLEQGQRMALERNARAAQAEAVQAQVRLRAALARGELEAAEAERERLESLDREQPGFSELARELLRARFLEPLQAFSGSEPGRAWAGLNALAGREPRLPELPEARALLEEMGEALAARAEKLLAGGGREAARTDLEALGSGPLAGHVPYRAPLLAAWAEAQELAEAGRLAEACAFAGGLSGALPAAGQWAGVRGAAAPPCPLAAWTWRNEGEVACQGPAGGPAHQVWDRVREVLAESVSRDRRRLEEAEAHLEAGRPATALALLAHGGSASLQPRAARLCQAAWERIQAGGRALGEWRAALALLEGPELLPVLAGNLERALSQDQEAPGVLEAKEAQDQVQRALGSLERARAALASGDGAAARASLAAPLPAGARLLRVEQARLLLEAARIGGRVCQAAGPFAVHRSTCATAGSGLVLRVAAAGDLLVVPRERLVIGSIANPGADLGLLARLGREHAELVRTLRFHKGVEHRLRACAGQEVSVGGEAARERVLEPGDLVGLGPAVRFRFLKPVPTSATPLLLFEADFEIEGCRRVAWLKRPGWDGALRIGPEAESHLRVPGGRAWLEFAMDRQERLLVRASAPFTIDGSPAGKEAVVALRQELQCAGLTVFVDARPRRAGLGSSEGGE